MKKEIRLRDLINVDYTYGDTPEDDLGMIPYQYIKRHRGQIGEDSLHTMHMDAWYEILDNAPPEVSTELMIIDRDKKPGLLNGADKIKIDNILQKTSNTQLQKAIRTFMHTMEMVMHDEPATKSTVNESILQRRARRLARTVLNMTESNDSIDDLVSEILPSLHE